MAVRFDREAVENMLERWRERLVPEWTVRLLWHENPADEEGGKDVQARVDPSEHYLSAVIALGPRWKSGFTEGSRVRDLDPEYELEVVLVHELLHLVLHDLSHVVESLEDLLGGPVYGRVSDEYVHNEERAIDRLARALVAR